MKDAICITGVDLSKLIKEAYNLSRPQGLGFYHFEEGELPDAEVAEILAQGYGKVVVSMDYVRGRAVKMTVWQEPDGLWIRSSWFDHSATDLGELLSRLGIELSDKEIING